MAIGMLGQPGEGVQAHLSPSQLSCGSQVAAAPGLLVALRKEVAGRRAMEGYVGEGS